MNDFQRKQMSEEAIEARKYVEFYRFWAWEYTRRNPEFREILSAINEVEKHFHDIGISDFTMSAQGIADQYSIYNYQPHINREFSEDELDKFRKALGGKMKARYEFGFQFTGPRPNSGYNSSEILELLQNEIGRASRRERV